MNEKALTLDSMKRSMGEIMMAYKTQWVIQDRLVYGQLSGDMTVEDMTVFNQENEAILEEGVPLVHFLIHDADLTSVPISLGTLSNVLSFIKGENLGWVVTIGEGSFRMGEFLSATLARIAQVRYKRVATLQEAIDFLQPLDPTLDWDNADYSVLPDEYAEHIVDR